MLPPRPCMIHLDHDSRTHLTNHSASVFGCTTCTARRHRHPLSISRARSRSPVPNCRGRPGPLRQAGEALVRRLAAWLGSLQYLDMLASESRTSQPTKIDKFENLTPRAGMRSRPVGMGERSGLISAAQNSAGREFLCELPHTAWARLLGQGPRSRQRRPAAEAEREAK
jgi:hypothetical protein